MADQARLARALQTELKRVGSDPGSIDGVWGDKAKGAFADFARHAKIVVKSDYPTEATLQQLLAQKDRVCPIECDADQVLRAGKCVARGARTATKGTQESRGAAHPANPSSVIGGQCNGAAGPTYAIFPWCKGR